jgi:release factor glutamine methyltransferase
VAALLGLAEVILREAGVETARLDAEVLLGHVLGWPRHRLLAEREHDPGWELRGRFLDLVERRRRREPLQYLTGRQEFWSLDFPVGPGVLIPRPETELLVEEALRLVAGRPDPLVLEIGPGSGAVAVSLAVARADLRVVAVDLSETACGYTRRASLLHGVAERVDLLRGDLFAPLAPGLAADLVVANPPYVAAGTLDGLQPEVARHEPRLALDGGADGLEVIRRLLTEAGRHLRPGGHLLLEAGFDQGEAIRALAARSGGWRGHRVLTDLAGHPRLHVLTFPSG